MRVEEVLGRHFDAEGEHNRVDCPDLKAGDTAAHEHVDLILPLSEHVRAARVVDARLARGEVVLIVRAHPVLERQHDAAIVVHLETLGVRVED